MSVQSPCKIEFQPAGEDTWVTLLDVGDWVTEPPRWSVDQNLFEAEGVFAANAFFRPLGAVVLSLVFETETDMDNHADALEAFATSELIDGVDVMAVEGALAITSEERVTTYASAVLNVQPGLPFNADFSTVLRAFSITTSLPTSAVIPDGDPS